VKRLATSANGFQYEVSLERGDIKRFRDFIGGEKDFADVRYCRYLTIKGSPNRLKGLYDVVRAKSMQMFGVNPIAMPITQASFQAVFVWPESKVKDTSLDNFIQEFCFAISLTKVVEEKLPKARIPRNMYRKKRSRGWRALGAFMIVVIVGYLVYVVLHTFGML
jgi:hypothetical protein